MSGAWPKIIRDPVHDIVSFHDSPCDRLLLALIETPEFQRLRRIKQLGLGELVFPGANHSRFGHSIGVMHMARRFLSSIERDGGVPVDEEQRVTLLTAALLHDVGHGPFSHSFEAVTGQRHELRTLEIIQSPETEVHGCLTRHDNGLPVRLAALLDAGADGHRNTPAVPAILAQVVSSQLDADRFDYLLRDSYFTGAQYGRFDASWLIQHLHLDPRARRFFVSHKAIVAAEAYVYARYYMYKTVYFHKTSRAAEVMLRLLFKHFSELLGAKKTRSRLAASAPGSLVEAFSSKMTMEQYLLLDDHSIGEFLRFCKSADDAVLAELGTGILNRKLYKAIEATGAAPGEVETFKARVVDAVGHKKPGLDYSFVEDAPGDTAYEPYDPDADAPARQIYVETTQGEIKELSTESHAVRQLREPYRLLRFYFPEALRAKIDRIAKATMHGGGTM
jgi:uncharacterized protein